MLDFVSEYSEPRKSYTRTNFPTKTGEPMKVYGGMAQNKSIAHTLALQEI